MQACDRLHVRPGRGQSDELRVAEGSLTLCINSTISTMSTESLDRVAVFTLLLYELEILLRNFTLDSQVVGIQPIGSNKLAHGVLAP
jgi:hypothetical protein